MSSPEASPARPGVVVAPMRRRHLRAVVRIEEKVNPSPWSHGLFLGELNQPSDRRSYLVAKVDGTVVGHAGLMLVVDDGHITTVAVDPAWQRRGVATRLLLVLVPQAVRLGAENLTLEVRSSNLAAQALYRCFGFEEAGLRKGYYSDSGEDAVIMWATGVSSPRYAERLAALSVALEGPPLVDEVSRFPVREARR